MSALGQWLVAIASVGLPGAHVEVPTEQLDDHDWQRLMQAVYEQRLGGLFGAAADAGALPITPAQAEQVTAARIELATQALYLENATLDAVDVLRGADIGPIVLKGCAVAHLDYPDPALRGSGDIDLLVRSEEFDAATAALTAAGHERIFPEPRPGYDRRFSKGTCYRTPDGLELDLHRTFVSGPVGLTVRLEDLWTDPVDFFVGGTRLQAMGAEQRLLQVCFAAALDAPQARWAQCRDIAEMLLFGSVDQARLRRMAQSWQAESVLAVAVLRAWQRLQLADVLATTAWAAEHRPDARSRRRLALYAARNHSYASMSLAAVGSLPRWRDRAAMLSALVVPHRGYIDDRYDGRLDRWLHGAREMARGANSAEAP